MKVPISRTRFRLLIAEDNEPLCEALRFQFKDDEEFVCAATTSRVSDIVPLCLKHEIELVVLDLDLHGKSSLIELPGMCTALPDVRFVIFTGHSDPEIMRVALKAGASAYVTKSTRTEKLLEALRQVGAKLAIATRN